MSDSLFLVCVLNRIWCSPPPHANLRARTTEPGSAQLSPVITQAQRAARSAGPERLFKATYYTTGFFFSLLTVAMLPANSSSTEERVSMLSAGD